MEICYKLEHFEGPLDLLLHLIEKNKVSIYDIPIVTITEQYLDYVSRMEKEDLDVVSEFLVMAATLIDIKSRMLLPAEEEEEADEEDPRAELVRRLLEYKMYKLMAQELEEREQEAESFFYKMPTINPLFPLLDYSFIYSNNDYTTSSKLVWNYGYKWTRAITSNSNIMD